VDDHALSRREDTTMSTETSDRDPPAEGLRLAPPPRVVSRDLARYLTLIYYQLPLALLGFGMIAFWANCGFGADVKSLLFLMPLRQTQGRVLRFEPTGTQMSAEAAPLEKAAPTGGGGNVPVEAVHFSYGTPSGGRRSGVCYALGEGEPAVPIVPTPQGRLTLDPGAVVPVEYVAARPGLARIRGTITGVHGLYALIILVFPGVGLLMLMRGRRLLRRLLPLLASGREDPPGEFGALEEGTPNVTLDRFPFSRLSVRDGQLRAPAGYLPKLCFTPLLALGCNVWYVWANAAEVFYPIKVLLHPGQ